MSNSVRSHRLQPTRLLCPQDSLGKNTGVGCHFLFCLHVQEVINQSVFLIKTVSFVFGRALAMYTGSFLEFCKFSSVQSLSHVQLFAIPWTAACQVFLSITSSQRLLKLMSTESVMPSSRLILCCTLSFCLQSFPTSGSF